MNKKEIEVTVDKNNKVDFHDFIEMKIKYDEEYFKKDKEIERLKKINEEHRILNGELRKELQQKENIIKEVREYIQNPIHEMSVKSYQELLEILDKGSDSNE